MTHPVPLLFGLFLACGGATDPKGGDDSGGAGDGGDAGGDGAPDFSGHFLFETDQDVADGVVLALCVLGPPDLHDFGPSAVEGLPCPFVSDVLESDESGSYTVSGDCDEGGFTARGSMRVEWSVTGGSTWTCEGFELAVVGEVDAPPGYGWEEGSYACDGAITHTEDDEQMHHGAAESFATSSAGGWSRWNSLDYLDDDTLSHPEVPWRLQGMSGSRGKKQTSGEGQGHQSAFVDGTVAVDRRGAFAVSGSIDDPGFELVTGPLILSGENEVTVTTSTDFPPCILRESDDGHSGAFLPLDGAAGPCS